MRARREVGPNGDKSVSHLTKHLAKIVFIKHLHSSALAGDYTTYDLAAAGARRDHHCVRAAMAGALAVAHQM